MSNSNDRTRWTDERLDQLASFIFANAEAIRESAEAVRESNERMTRLEENLTRVELLAESNSQAIQALTDDLVTFRLTVESDRENAREEREELRQATLGIANLLSSLDSDKPTILRKLDTIGNKVDQLLQQENGEQT